jgi:hypothetical protein
VLGWSWTYCIGDGGVWISLFHKSDWLGRSDTVTVGAMNWELVTGKVRWERLEGKIPTGAMMVSVEVPLMVVEITLSTTSVTVVVVEKVDVTNGAV